MILILRGPKAGWATFHSSPFTFNDALNPLAFFPISNVARPVVNVSGEAPVAGYLKVKLASCFASNARPGAEVMWRLGDLENFLMTETSDTMNPDGTITVVSYLLGVPLKHLNKKNIQCVVKHITQKEELVLDYTINIHCKYTCGVSSSYIYYSTFLTQHGGVTILKMLCLFLLCNPKFKKYGFSFTYSK